MLPFDSWVLMWREPIEGGGLTGERASLCKATGRTMDREVYLSAQMLSHTLRVYMHVCMCITSQISPICALSSVQKLLLCHSNLCSAYAHTPSHTRTVHKSHLSQIIVPLHSVTLSWHVLLELSWKQDCEWTKMHTNPRQTHAHTDWAAELKQLSAVQFGRPAGVSNQASNKIKREGIEARSRHRRHSVWPKHKQTLAAFCRLSERYPRSYISTHTQITDLLNVQFIYTVSKSGQKQLMSPAELWTSIILYILWITFISINLFTTLEVFLQCPHVKTDRQF